MELFIAWRSTANIEVERATRDNEPEMARRASTGIDSGNMLIQSWVLSSGGEMVVTSGIEGQAKVPADKLDELPDLLERYEQATDSRISVGVGFEPHESDTALRVAEARGGKPAVVLFNEDVAREAHELEESKQDDELGPILPEDEAALEDGAPESDGGVEPTLNKAEGDAKPGEASKVVAGTIKPDAAAMSAPSSITPASMPSGSPAGAPAPAPGQTQDSQQLKQAVASVLQDVKQNMAAIQQLQQADPRAFQSVTGLIQAFIQVAQQLFGPGGDPQQMQKSEDSVSPSSLEGDDQLAAQSLLEEAKAVRDYDQRKGKASSSKLKGALEHAIEEEKEHAEDFVDAMEKDEIHPMHPMTPGKRHDIIEPVGTQLDTGPDGTRNAGKIKIRHQDGKTGYVSVRAGQILSQDGHPISSRNPGGR
jgi:hypothetical protein